MFVAVSFTAAKIWKQPKCLSVDELIKKLWNIYTTLLWRTKKEILCLETARVAPESTMLSEISQSEKHKYHMISLIRGI